MRYNFCFLLIVLPICLLSQNDIKKNYAPPEFKEGPSGFRNYLNNYLHYPPSEYGTNTEGNVMATIRIDSSGTVEEILTKGENSVLNKEVKRVLTLMPAWISAKLNGVSIDTTIVREIFFSIQNSRIKGDTTKFELIQYRVEIDLTNKDEMKKMREPDKKYVEAKAIYDKGVLELQKKKCNRSIGFIQPS